ncbi:MAG: alpha/beta hydrolase [Pirellulales bacterium]
MIDSFARHTFFVTTLAAVAGHAAGSAADPAPMMATEAAETIRLWPGDAPGARGTADHDIPMIAWWPAPKSPTPSAALVICPGGGYGGLADHEGSDYAKWLNSQGISAFVLRYRLGSKGYRHPVMLGDVSRAIRLVRHDHERLGIDPKRVGVMGSSAGGHLALTSCIQGGPGDATAPDAIDHESARPDLGVLCYPVVSMLPEKTHGGSRKNLLGDAPSDELSRELSGELAAHDNTPPLFVWHTWEDKAVKLEPILELGLRLKSLARPYELHVYETGMHGLGLGVRPYDGMKQLHPWTVECRRWLGAQGF